LGFNGRIFLWVFRLADHKLFIEMENEFNRTLSPQRAGKLFSILFADLGTNSPFVEVTVVPDEDSIDRLLAIPKLKKLEIHLKRPNADDIGAAATRIMARLEGMGAKSQDIVLTANAGENLEPDQETIVYARVAALNGFVQTKGYEANELIRRSTKEYPKIIKRLGSAFATRLSAAISAAKDTILGD
jgi:hypothetical protein